jgi:peptidyl-prolyl cis-trans isomerase SurA
MGPEKFDADSILKTLNRDSQLDITVKRGPFEKESNKWVAEKGWRVGFSNFKVDGDQVSFIYTRAILLPQPKKLEEAKGAAISDYQSQLEKEWIEELRSKFKVEVHKEVLQ